MHFAFSPFDCASVLAETELVKNLWWAGLTSLTRARLIASSIVGVVSRRSGGCVCSIIIIITRSESITRAMRGLAFVITAIRLFINLLGGFAL